MRFSHAVFTVAALVVIGGCSSPPAGLEVLVDQPSGTAPATLEVRVYDRFRQLATERIAKPVLPGAVRLTSLPSSSDQLRVVVLGLDATSTVKLLAGSTLGTPAAASATVAVHLSASYADVDQDGVPDALDDCPTVADADQNDARGFGSGPGDACLAPAVPDGSAGGNDMGSGSNCPSGDFCDDFEGAQIDTTRWTISQTAGSVIAVDTSRAYHGQSSLHVQMGALTAGSLGFVTIKEQATFPATTIHARAFIYVPTAFGDDVAAIMLVEQSVSPFGGIGLQLEAGGFSIFNGLQNQSVAPGGMVAHDSWSCVEWAVTIGTGGGAVLSVNGQALAAPIVSGDTTSTPPVGELAIGLVANATNDEAARELWMDDLVVSGQPIGCQ